jgi:hypothetical protein
MRSELAEVIKDPLLHEHSFFYTTLKLLTRSNNWIKPSNEAVGKRPSAALPSSLVTAAYFYVRLIPRDFGSLAYGHFANQEIWFLIFSLL